MTTKLIKGYEIPIFLKDNGAKDTLVFIHGFNSSYKFCLEIAQQKNNFNIVSFSLPGSKDVPTDNDISIKLLREVASEVILKTVKSSRVHIVAHSLGGLIASKIASNKRVKSITYVATVHPRIMNSKLFSLYEKVATPDTKIKKLSAAIIKASVLTINKITDADLKQFIDAKSPWFKMAQKELFSESTMTELDVDYKRSVNKSHFLVGERDVIIATKEFITYVEEDLNRVVNIVPGGHAPFKDAKIQSNNFLNSNTKFKKRFFPKLRKIIK